MASLVNSTILFRKILCQFYTKSSIKYKRRKYFPIHFMRLTLFWYLNQAKLLQTCRHFTHQYPQEEEVKCLTTSFSDIGRKTLICSICQFLCCRYDTLTMVYFKLTTQYQPASQIREILKIRSHELLIRKAAEHQNIF